MALASLLEMMWADEFVDERDARFINDRVHANIQRDGTFSVVPQMKGGVTTSAQLRRIADVADKYRDPDDQAHRRPAHRPARRAQGGSARGVGGPRTCRPGYAYGKSFRTVKTCVGSDFCRYGVGDSTALGIAIEERFQGLRQPRRR